MSGANLDSALFFIAPGELWYTPVRNGEYRQKKERLQQPVTRMHCVDLGYQLAFGLSGHDNDLADKKEGYK